MRRVRVTTHHKEMSEHTDKRKNQVCAGVGLLVSRTDLPGLCADKQICVLEWNSTNKRQKGIQHVTETGSSKDSFFTKCYQSGQVFGKYACCKSYLLLRLNLSALKLQKENKLNKVIRLYFKKQTHGEQNTERLCTPIVTAPTETVKYVPRHLTDEQNEPSNLQLSFIE